MEDHPVPARLSLPRLGEPAPPFEAVTTFGTLQLSDFAGQWLILFSHPADFTPVCTTEFIGFAKLHPTLRAMNCELLGLSIDSLYSHIAWVRNIEEKFGATISFPVIADSDRAIARRYGMVMQGESQTETSRCVFVLDDAQIIRAMIYYPMNVGRNMEEIVRLLQALQISSKEGVATPANWKPGDPVVVPPPHTQADAEKRMQDTALDCTDWYFSKRELP